MKEFKINKKNYIKYFFLLLVFIFLVSFRIGRYPVPIKLLFRVIGSRFLPVSRNWDSTIETVIFQIRMPRIIASVFVGASLSLAGAVYQGVFKNPLVSPDILGVSSGAGFGAALGILLSFNKIGIQLSAFSFGILSVLLVYYFSSKIKESPILSLLIVGVLIGSAFTSLTSLIKYMADSNNKLPTISFWLMGGLSDLVMRDLEKIWIPIIFGILPLYLLRWRINILSLDEDEAKTLGLDTRKLRLVIIVSSTLITAFAVSISGLVGWVGLLIPHLARQIVGPDYEVLLPTSMLLGASYLLAIDNISRAITSVEIPLGIMTSLIGVPIFLLILLNKRPG